MTNKDLFHNAVEGRMEELKQKPIVEEKETRGEKINKIFFFMFIKNVPHSNFLAIRYYFIICAFDPNPLFFNSFLYVFNFDAGTFIFAFA